MAFVYLEAEVATHVATQQYQQQNPGRTPWIQHRYVCAEGGGGQHLIPNRAVRLEWESFVVTDHTVSGGLCLGDTISLKSHNGPYVQVVNGGQLIANAGGNADVRTRFKLRAWNDPGDTHAGKRIDTSAPGYVNGRGVPIALVSLWNGNHVQASNGGGPLYAANQNFGQWELMWFGFCGANRERPSTATWRNFPSIA